MSPKEILKYGLEADAKRTGFRLLPEHVFHETRKWRFDWAFPDYKVAIEYDGHHTTGNVVARRAGLKQKSRSGHSTITGISGDHEKTNTAQLEGWIVLRFTALHFDEKARKKNKLTPPFAAIREALYARKAFGQGGDPPGNGVLDLRRG